MGFTVDTNNVPENNGGIMTEGDYEVVIAKVEEKTANSGSVSVQIELVVRNDVNQSYKNKHIWYQIWDTQKTRETGMYAKNINNISKHAGIQNGATFNSIDDWGRFLYGKPLLATVKHDTYNGKTREKVTFIGASKSPQCLHQWNATGSNNSANDTGTVPVSKDDDLPF